jgi:hypothetical protein
VGAAKRYYNGQLAIALAACAFNLSAMKHFVTTCWLFMVILAFGQVVGPATAALQAAVDQIASAESTQSLIALIDDEEASQARRAAAVLALVEADTRDGYRALAHRLADEAMRGVQTLVIHVLHDRYLPPPVGLADALIDLLRRGDELWLDALAATVGRYTDARAVSQLDQFADDDALDPVQRRGPILGLGHLHTLRAAQILIRLIQPAQPPAIRDAAFDALAILAWSDRFGHDVGAWNDWWQAHQQLSIEQWQVALHENLRRQHEVTAGQLRAANVRLVRALNDVHRETPATRKPELLAKWLDDHQPLEVRLLAMKLLENRFITNEPIEGELRTVLLDRLVETSPVMRRKATLLLHDLNEDDAAKWVAQRLIDGAERDSDVLRASLTLLSRLPREEAIDVVMGMLSSAVLGDEAAGALAGAMKKKMLSASQADRLRQAVDEKLAALASDDVPSRELIALTGHIDAEVHWQHIEGWLNSTDESTRRAAAQAWADGGRLLLPLVKRAGDPVIWMIVIRAATARGKDQDTLLTLVEHRPPQDAPQRRSAWDAALVAMAGRVDPQAVVCADETLAKLDSIQVMREAFLTAAIAKLLPDNGDGQPSKEHAPVLTDLLLARAQLRLMAGNAQAAAQDLQRIDGIGHKLAGEKANRYSFAIVRARLATGDVGGALGVLTHMHHKARAQKIEVPVLHALLKMVLDNIDQSLEAEQLPRAEQLIVGLAKLNEAMTPTQRERIAELAKALKHALAQQREDKPDPEIGKTGE